MPLGLVLTPYGKVPGAYPWEIAKSVQGFETFYCPMDPQYFQRGEYGYYYDTPLGTASKQSLFNKIKKLFKKKNGLGAIPTDYEIGKYYYSWYTPVQSGWIYADDPKRYIPGPWVPPDNTTVASPYGPPTSLNGITLPHRGKRAPTFAGTHVNILGDTPGDVPPPAHTDAPNQPTVETPAAPELIAVKPATAEDVVRILNEYQQKQFMLSAIGTAAGVAAAAFALFRSVTGIQADMKERDRRSATVK